MRGIFVHSTNRQKDYEKDSNCILNAITCWVSEFPTSRTRPTDKGQSCLTGQKTCCLTGQRTESFDQTEERAV